MVQETYPILSVLYGGDILETKRLLNTLLYYIKNRIGSQSVKEAGIMLDVSKCFGFHLFFY